VAEIAAQAAGVMAIRIMRRVLSPKKSVAGMVTPPIADAYRA
jgi:hypothetical protein